MQIDLSDKLAIVSGSTAGIGFAIASGLAAAGATVVVNGRSQAAVTVRSRRSGTASRMPGARRRRRPGHGGRLRGFRCGRAEGGHPGQQPGHLRAEGLLRHRGRRVEPLLRGQRDVRGAPGPRLRPGNGRAWLGASGVPVFGIGVEHPGGHDPLRLQQDRQPLGVARPGQAPGRHRGDGECGAARTDPHRRRRRDASRGCAEGRAEHRRGRHRLCPAARSSSIIQRLATPEEVANLVVYTCSTQASATTGAALRVDGGVLDSLA